VICSVLVAHLIYANNARFRRLWEVFHHVPARFFNGQSRCLGRGILTETVGALYAASGGLSCPGWVVPALGQDIPHEPGLYELRAGVEENEKYRGLEARMCIDEATDPGPLMGADPPDPQQCSKYDEKRSGGTLTVDMECKTAGGKSVSGQLVFNDAGEFAMTTQGEGGKTGIFAMKRISPCAADQKPGNIMMGSFKINITDLLKFGDRLHPKEMQKSEPSQGLPTPK
jgi:Protein of unknown function (DUF3617)